MIRTSNNNDCQIILLPQNKNGWAIDDICKCIKSSNSSLIDELSIAHFNVGESNNRESEYWKAQHMHIVSFGDICVGDKVILNADGRNDVFVIGENSADYYSAKTFIYGRSLAINKKNSKELRIIATTQSELGLPMIPKSFIQEYVAAQGTITDVELEKEHLKIEDTEVGGAYLYAYESDGKTKKYAYKLTDNNEVIIGEGKKEITIEDLTESTEDFHKQIEEAFIRLYKNKNVSLENLHMPIHPLYMVYQGFQQGARYQKLISELKK